MSLAIDYPEFCFSARKTSDISQSISHDISIEESPTLCWCSTMVFFPTHLLLVGLWPEFRTSQKYLGNSRKKHMKPIFSCHQFPWVLVRWGTIVAWNMRDERIVIFQGRSQKQNHFFLRPFRNGCSELEGIIYLFVRCWLHKVVLRNWSRCKVRCVRGAQQHSAWHRHFQSPKQLLGWESICTASTRRDTSKNI